MSQSIVPLDKRKHAKLTFSPSEDFGFTAEMNAVPLVGLEVADASGCLPVVFLPGKLLPHALLGLGQSNVFLDEKRRWTADYTPLYIANYPFSLAHVNNREKADDPEAVLAIDEEAPHFKGEKGAPLYTPDGGLSDFSRRALESLVRQRRHYEMTVSAVRELEEHGILMEEGIHLQSDGQKKSIQGLRVANREKVMALPDDILARWSRNGLLELLFAHWTSLKHLHKVLEK